MIRRSIRPLIFALTCLAMGQECLAVPPLPDERLEWYEVQDDALLRRIGDATCFATQRSLLTPRTDGDYDLAVSAFTQVQSAALCEDVPFYGQVTTGDFSGSTATLVGQDLVLCVRHAFPPETVLSTRAFIFDYNQNAADEPPLGLSPGSTIPVDAKDVFFPVAIVAHSKVGYDWTLVRLDRPVSMDRIPIPLQQGESRLNESDETVIVGHGDRLPKKFSRGFVTPYVLPGADFFLIGAHATAGNSGSPVVSVESGRYHGIVVSSSLFLSQTPAGCYGYCTDCDVVVRANANDPRLLLNVPLISLQCDAPATMQHYGPPGGPFTEAESKYQLTVPTGSRAIDYRITVEGGSWIEVLADGSGLSGHLKAGGGTTAQVRLTNEASLLAPGVYHATVTFHDDVYSTRTVTRHTLNVGVGAIAVSPDEPIIGDGPGAPLWTEKTYTVTNRCDVPVAVDITSGATWVHVDHVPAEQIVVPAQSDVDVTVTLFRDCDIIDDPGIYETEVAFVANFGTALPPEVMTRPVRMDFGRWHYQNVTTLPLTLQTGLNEHLIDVPENAVLEDIDIEIVGYVIPRFLSSYSVFVTSPSGTRVDIINSTTHGQLGSAPTTLDGVFDDETFPPADPDGLATLIGEQIQGQWKVTVEQIGTPGFDQGSLERAVLRIRGPRWTRQPPCGDPGDTAQLGFTNLLQFLEQMQTGDLDLNSDGRTTAADLNLLLDSWSHGLE